MMLKLRAVAETRLEQSHVFDDLRATWNRQT